MAKKMLKAQRGVIAKLMKDHEKSKAELAALTGVDWKTLHRIDLSIPVKDTTLQQVANRVGVPLGHLIDGVNTPTDEKAESLDYKATEEIMIRPVEPDRLRNQLTNCGRVRWHLDLMEVSADLAARLEEFEACIEALRMHINSEISVPDTEAFSLKYQLRFTKNWSAIQEQIASLRSQNIEILTGTYLFWISDEMFGHYDQPHHLQAVEYSSTKVLLVGIY